VIIDRSGFGSCVLPYRKVSLRGGVPAVQEAREGAPNELREDPRLGNCHAKRVLAPDSSGQYAGEVAPADKVAIARPAEAATSGRVPPSDPGDGG
jgi:hypothetical protein